MTDLNLKDSTNLHWARYDEAAQRLEIDFKNAQGVKVSTYAYDNFSPEEWAQFNASSSKGKHFAYRIRPRFKGVKIWSAK